MEQKIKENNENEVDKSKKNKFNISVTYEKNGKSFQEVIESILLRKLGEN